MGAPLSEMTINGFKSIRSLSNFKLNNLNILIGSNGSGKSNVVDFFRLLESMAVRQLSTYALSRGVDSLFFNGPKETEEIYAELLFKINGYRFSLRPSATESLFVSREESAKYNDWAGYEWRRYEGARAEARLADWGGEGGRSIVSGFINVCGHIFDAISSWRVYHFHDTSYTAPLRRSGEAQDTEGLRNDGSNLGPFLLHLQEEHPLVYQRIVNTIQLIAPYFQDFKLTRRTTGTGIETVRLEWMQKHSNFPFTSAHFSDGTLRFIALATALLQPDPPSTIVIDEPELGLHPYALTVLSALLSEAAQRMQVIVATQAPALLNDVEPDNIVIVERKDGQTVLHRLNRPDIDSWLDEYSLSELWEKNVIHAGPDHA
ncbi:MAG: AAA family ATPase [Acidobacteriota bacterium]